MTRERLAESLQCMHTSIRLIACEVGVFLLFKRDNCIALWNPLISLPMGGQIIGKLPITYLPTITHTLAPSAPTIVSVEATSSTSISVQWNGSKKEGGSPITQYVVEYHAASDPTSSFETQLVARDVFSMTLDGLTPSTEYDVRVRGENAVGRSVPSATMRAKTDGELIERIRSYRIQSR